MKTSKPIIAIDVDQTVVDMLEDWSRWCQDTFNEIPDFSVEISDMKFLGFWEISNIYDNKKPIKNTVKYIKELHKHYHIFFVSHCHPNHFQSKIQFLLRYFEMDGFIDMYEKHRIHFDYIIDDRDIFFKDVTEGECILYNDNWGEIFSYLMLKIDRDKI